MLAGHDQGAVREEDARHPLPHLLGKVRRDRCLRKVPSPGKILVGSQSLAEVEHRGDSQRATAHSVDLFGHDVIPHHRPRCGQLAEDVLHAVVVEDRRALPGMQLEKPEDIIHQTNAMVCWRDLHVGVCKDDLHDGFNCQYICAGTYVMTFATKEDLPVWSWA